MTASLKQEGRNGHPAVALKQTGCHGGGEAVRVSLPARAAIAALFAPLTRGLLLAEAVLLAIMLLGCLCCDVERFVRCARGNWWQ